MLPQSKLKRSISGFQFFCILWSQERRKTTMDIDCFDEAQEIHGLGGSVTTTACGHTHVHFEAQYMYNQHDCMAFDETCSPLHALHDSLCMVMTRGIIRSKTTYVVRSLVNRRPIVGELRIYLRFPTTCRCVHLIDFGSIDARLRSDPTGRELVFSRLPTQKRSHACATDFCM